MFPRALTHIPALPFTAGIFSLSSSHNKGERRKRGAHAFLYQEILAKSQIFGMASVLPKLNDSPACSMCANFSEGDVP